MSGPRHLVIRGPLVTSPGAYRRTPRFVLVVLMTERERYSLQEAADELGVSVHLVAERCRREALTHIEVGPERRVMFDRDMLEEARAHLWRPKRHRAVDSRVLSIGPDTIW